MTRQSGMTLIEVLVAMAIFAVMGAVASLLLRQTLDNSELLGDRMNRLQALQRAMTALSSELLQTAPRPVRAELGNAEPALQSSFSAEFALQLTHNGWPNSSGRPRSTQRRSAYRIEDDELIRYHWNVLDRTVSNVPVATVLLDEVDSLTFRFLQSSGEWTDQWPPIGASDTAASSELPRAVEITLVLPDEGELTRVVEVAQ
jgi:general secretion pathway protein J